MDSALIVDAFVLAAVLESDLGAHRKVTTFRLIRPILIALGIIPLFLTAVATHGHGLALELVLAVVGILVGLLATAFMTVYRNPETGRPVSRAGAAYAALWIVVVGARAAFTYGSHHWFAPTLEHWMVRNAITADAITDGLIFMAVAMVLTRTIALSIRARRLPATTSTDTSSELRAA
jgi:hypothetical protein